MVSAHPQNIDEEGSEGAVDELHAEPNEEEKEQVDHDVLSGSVEQGISEIAPHLCVSSPDDCYPRSIL